MKKFAIAGIAALSIAASTAVYAQHHHWGFGHMRMNPEDRAAFLDARVAAVRAGLKLIADQEKLWPPVEAAVRDFAKLRIDRANARMNAEKNDWQAHRRPMIRSPGCASAPTTWRQCCRAEEDRRCRRPALQNARRRPEAASRRADPYGAPVRRRGLASAPVRARHGSWF